MYYVISVVQVLVQDLISVIKALICLPVIAIHKGKDVHICKSICTYVTLLVTFVKKKYANFISNHASVLLPYRPC